MDAVTVLDYLGLGVRLVGSLLLLIVFILRTRGSARVLGAVGAVLLAIPSLRFYVAFAIIEGMDLDVSQTLPGVLGGLNLLGSLFSGAAVIMIAYAIVTGVRSAVRSGAAGSRVVGSA